MGGGLLRHPSSIARGIHLSMTSTRHRFTSNHLHNVIIEGWPLHNAKQQQHSSNSCKNIQFKPIITALSHASFETTGWLGPDCRIIMPQSRFFSSVAQTICPCAQGSCSFLVPCEEWVQLGPSLAPVHKRKDDWGDGQMSGDTVASRSDACCMAGSDSPLHDLSPATPEYK
jgi:hypothetical protein